MSQLLATAKPAAASGPAPGPVAALQRKCACGGSAGLTGECEACRTKRLAFGTIGDDYETEADHVADAILRRRDGSSRVEPLTRNGPPVQRRLVPGALQADVVPPVVRDTVSTSGTPLDRATRSFFGRRFGHDFGRVRVHADTRAAVSAHAVHALAYTAGHHIVFGAGQYAPGTGAGDWLLAHELAHVVQQQSAGDAPAIQRSEARRAAVAAPVAAPPFPGDLIVDHDFESIAGTDLWQRVQSAWAAIASSPEEASGLLAGVAATLRSPRMRIGGARTEVDGLREEIEYLLGQQLLPAGYEEPRLEASFAAMGDYLTDIDRDFVLIEAKGDTGHVETFLEGYKGLVFLDSVALGNDLRAVVAESEDSIPFVLSVFDALASNDRDAVAYYFVEPLDEDDLAQIATSEAGQTLLTRLRDEMTGGIEWPSETTEILQLVRVLSAAEQPIDFGSVPIVVQAPTPPAAKPKTAAPPFPGHWSAANFLTVGGVELWDVLRIAWQWADASPTYSHELLESALTSHIPALERDAAMGIGGRGLAPALERLRTAFAAVSAVLADSAEGPVLPRAQLVGPFENAVSAADTVDELLPATLMEGLEQLADVDPLIRAYLVQFPSEPEPAELDMQMKIRLALALSAITFPEALRTATLEAVRSPFFIPSVVIPVTVWAALVAMPEPTTKTLALAMTAFMLTMFAWNDIVDFALAWTRLMQTCWVATTTAELRWAGTRMMTKGGEVTFDALAMVIFMGMQESAGAALRGRARVLAQKHALENAEGRKQTSGETTEQAAAEKTSVASEETSATVEASSSGEASASAKSGSPESAVAESGSPETYTSATPYETGSAGSAGSGSGSGRTLSSGAIPLGSFEAPSSKLPVAEVLAQLRTRVDAPYRPDLENATLGKSLGTGAYKEAFVVEGHENLVIAKLQNPQKAWTLLEELNSRNRLKNLGLPVAKVTGITVHDGYPALVMEYYRGGGSKSILSEGGSPQFLNETSLVYLAYIRQVLIRENLFVSDLQFLIGADGRVVIADPGPIREGMTNVGAVDALSQKAAVEVLLKKLQPGHRYSAAGLRKELGVRINDGVWDGVVKSIQGRAIRELRYDAATETYTIRQSK